MSGQGVVCSRCGNAIAPGSVFCNRCGAPVGSSVSPPQAGPTTPRHERHEKHEKHEKQEKEEKREKGEKGGGSPWGALVGGSVLIWLGVSFYLQQIGFFGWNVWWAYFLIGLGAILLVDGLGRYAQTKRMHPGLLIGGAVLIFIGATQIEVGVQSFWPLILVLLGALVIAGGLSARRRSPTP